MKLTRHGRVALVATAATILGATGLFTAPARAAVTIVVDNDGKATVANCGAATAAPATINAAIAAASPGDTIKVCPGTYNESVLIDKTLRLLGAKVGVNGFTRVFNAASESIIATASTTLNAVSVGANNVFVDGFTMQNSNTGVETSPYNSGYVIRNNIIRNNVIGVHINSDGASQSLVTRNKVLANNKGFDAPSSPPFSGGGIISFGGLSNASITGNFVGQQRGAATFLERCDGGVNSNLTISSNTIQNSFLAVALASNNTGVTIQRNTIDDTMPSNDLDELPAILVVDTNTNVVVGGATDAAGNTVNNSPAVGIGVGDYGPPCSPGPLPPGGVSVAHNTVTKSGRTGIEVISSIPGRVTVNGNHLTNNAVPRPELSYSGGDGIFFSSSTAGNTISGNNVSGSGVLDCEDDSTGGAGGSPNFGTQNSWTLNTGGSDDPDGICPPPT